MKVQKVSEIIIFTAILIAGMLVFGNWIENRINRAPAQTEQTP